jgi:MFS family permease
VAIAVYGLARFLVAMPAGRLADGLGRRPVLALGGLVTAAGNLLCAYAPTFAALVAGRFVAGAGAALVLISGQIVLADITTPAHRGRTMAVYQGVFLFAVSIGPLPGGLLAEHYGLRAPFLAYAVAGLLAAALAWLFIPETKSGRDPGVPEAEPVSFVAQVRILTTQPGFMLASLVGLVVIYPSGVLVDRYGRKSVIVPATLMAGISLVLFLLAPSYAWFLAGCVAWSVASGVGGAAPAAYAADVAPPRMNAAAMSGFRMLSDLGYVVGPIALGLATDLVGADLTLGASALLLAATALLFARFAPETYRREPR